MLLQNDVFDYYFRIGRIASEVKHQFRLGDVYSLGIDNFGGYIFSRSELYIF